MPTISPQAFRDRRGTNALFAGLLALLSCLWWYPLLAGYLPNFMDTITVFYPIRTAAARQIGEGTLPLWLPNIFSGVPLAANPQHAIWYPPQLLFYLWPGALSYGILCILHYIWGGWGVWFFVRRVTGSRGGAFFAALTFQFSAMLVSRIALAPHVYAIVWVPWLLLAVERAVQERGFVPRGGALVVAGLFALQVLAGAPQITYYTALVLPLWWLMRTASVAKRERKAGNGHLLRRLGEAGIQGAGAALIAGLLTGIQLLPTAEFLQQAERSTIPLERLRGQALSDGFIWRALVGWTGPTIEDTDSINAIGPGAILLALLALARRSRRRLSGPLWVIGVLSFLLSLAPLVQFWSEVLPLYASMHAPRRALIFWTVAGCLAAGLGASVVDGWWRMRRWPRAGFYVLLLVLSGGTWWMLPRLERVFTRPDYLKPDERYKKTVGENRYLTLDPTFAYSYDSRRLDFGQSMISDLAALHGTYAVNGYDPLVLRRYGMARQIACAGSGIFYPSHGVFFSNPNASVLRLLNLQYLVGRFDLYDPGRLIPGTGIDQQELSGSLELVYEHPRWPLFRYRENRPLAWAVGQVLPVASAREALAAAARSNVYETAYSEEGFSFAGERGTVGDVTARHVDARTIEVRLAHPASTLVFVCVSTTWMPGWIARTADGAILPTTPINGLIAGVAVPAGTRSFQLRYQPHSFTRGALMTLAGALAWVALWARRKR